MLADPLLQSGVVTCNNSVQCAIKSTRKSICQNQRCTTYGRMRPLIMKFAAVHIL